jgi:hypothetical protein
MLAAPDRFMIRRWLPLLTMVSFAGCACDDTPVTRTAYVSAASFSVPLTACIVDHVCPPLCSAVFQLDGDVDIERCELTALDGPVPAAPPAAGAPPPDLTQLRGATVRVTYLEHAQCDDDFAAGIDGTTDDGSDDGTTDDGSDTGSDDGSMDDGGSGDGDDGGDDGGDDDGGGDDGGGDDGGGDDGGGDDDGGDATGGGSAIRHVPGPTLHAGGSALWAGAELSYERTPPPSKEHHYRWSAAWLPYAATHRRDVRVAA